MASPFNRIIFYAKDTVIGTGRDVRTKAAGTITVYKNAGNAAGDELYSQSLKDNPIWFYVGDGMTISINGGEAPNAPDFKSILPFGSAGDFANLRFGELTKVGEFELEQGSTSIQFDSGILDQFHLGIIGTDDLRNGKASAMVMDMQNMYVYLNLAAQDSDLYSLEIGYQQS